MGTRGPIPEPTSDKSQRGYNSAGRRLPNDPNAKPPGMPRGLPAAAQAFWRSNASALIASGRLTRSDAAAFERLCRTWAQLCSLDELLEAEGSITSTAAGGAKAHPACQLRTNAEKVFLSLAVQFGLTPQSRQRTPEVEQATPQRMRRNRQAEMSIEAKYLN